MNTTTAAQAIATIAIRASKTTYLPGGKQIAMKVVNGHMVQVHILDGQTWAEVDHSIEQLTIEQAAAKVAA